MIRVVDQDLDTLLTALHVFIDDHVSTPRRVGRPPWHNTLTGAPRERSLIAHDH